MNDFNHDNTPTPNGTDDMQTQQPVNEQQTENAQQPVNEQPMAKTEQAASEQPVSSQPQESVQQPAQAAEEPRTPFQTPVRPPEYQMPPQEPQADAAPQPPKKKARGKKVIYGLCGVAAACLLFASGAVLGSLADSGKLQNDLPKTAGGDAPTMQISNKPDLSPDNYDVVNGLAGEEVYKKVSPSVVSIIATTINGGGTGSGVIMTEDGYIITNNHVVEGADQVTVQMVDGTQYPAKVIGTDEETDLAVVKVAPKDKLQAAEFGNSDELQPGEYAYAIGSPGGVEFANTITGGRISAINRDVAINDRVMTLIQTDVSINPGNSGGALINKYGQVVGITSAKLSSNGFNEATIEGMGFAIPMNLAKEIVDELLKNGYIAGRPSLGITGTNIDAQRAKYVNVPQGVYVYSVDERAHANKEGLLAGDIIVEANGETITTMDDINAIKENMKAGDKMKLRVYRMSAGKFVNITVTLTDAHDLSEEAAQTQPQKPVQPQPNEGEGGYSQYDESPFFFNS